MVERRLVEGGRRQLRSRRLSTGPSPTGTGRHGPCPAQPQGAAGFESNPGDDQSFMAEALRQARKALNANEVPVGAVIVRGRDILAKAWNQVELLKDATAHAEMLAITIAENAIGDWRLTDCDLYVTKEPCPMCAGAIVHARIRRVIFGCPDPKGGAAGGLINLLQMPPLNHQCQITGGVLAAESAALLRDFFAARRERGGVD